MASIISFLENINFTLLLWIFAIAFALHEVEEWNIMKWYQRNFVDLPPTTDKGVRSWIVFISLIGFIWCFIAVLPGNPKIAMYVFIPAIAVALQNSLQHVYWLIYFRDYPPGVITAVLLLLPLGSYIIIEAIQKEFIPVWYVALWAVLIIPGLAQTVRAGNTMTSPMRAMHNFGNTLSQKIWKTP